MLFNPLNYPLCFEKPHRLTDITSWHQHIPFAFTIVQMLKPKNFVELGTHKGDSYCAFCQAVSILRLETACYAVDTWEGDDHAGFYEHELFDELKAYHDPLYSDFSQLLKTRFEDALNYFSDNSIDLLHIDGYHTYDAVKNDFEMWLPKMSKRGVILFHDTNVHERGFGVWKFWEELAGSYPSFEFKHGFGLGVIAVGTELPEVLLTFLNMSKDEIPAITRLYSYLGNKVMLDQQLKTRDIKINEITRSLQEKDTQINEMNRGLQEKDTQINEITRSLQERDTQINEITRKLQERDTQINEITRSLQEKDTQINEIIRSLQERDTKINEMNRGLQERDAQINQMNRGLQERDTQINQINRGLQERDTQINQMNRGLQEKETQINQMNRGLQERDTKINEMNRGLQERDAQINQMNRGLQERDTQINQMNRGLQERDTQINEITRSLQERDTQINEITRKLQERDTQINELNCSLQSMQESIVWNLLLKFHYGVVDRLLPPGTRRRNRYDIRLKGGRALVAQGRRSFLGQVKDHYFPGKNAQHTDTCIPGPGPAIQIPDNLDELPIIEQKVSVVIPTKNAGPDFEYTLEKINGQKGIKEIEMIIIDSGSTDKTILLAEKYGSKVYTIRPEDFNHGETRNYGAERATGDYLLFTVQDAIPINDYWLYNMVKVLTNDDKIVASTCRQVPRSDANLFACYSIWSHSRQMEFNEDRIMGLNKRSIDKLSLIEKRKLAGIDNVCSCIKSDIYKDFKFKKISFAEDLDLGIRLIESEYKIAFLHSVGVIHSHNRNPAYFMRRAYIDSISVVEILNIERQINRPDLNLALNAIIFQYISLNRAISTITSKYGDHIEIDSYFSTLKNCLYKNVPGNILEMENKTQLDDIFSELGNICEITHIDNKLLNENYLHTIQDFKNFVGKIYKNYKTADLIEATYSLFGVYCGSYLGNLYSHEINDQKMQQIDNLLGRGV